ncbi:uncharacterized protein LOC124118535 isoform X1 [Haliotis rufescens]|uniref:uncharacterized protein LOC124118535 isoform X1 n=2 Tax=Haliotis rufescens TaxID=6454 RepID=UPI00201F7945|nr:uncharacterized protein LOC124118535 isoform X1 [Haliotis rufescens]
MDINIFGRHHIDLLLIRMFQNVVSTRELLSDSFSSERQDTCELSYGSQQYSQLPYSQQEFSQVSTQDMFTQQLSSGSQNEMMHGTHSRKPTLYDKWKNKATSAFKQVPASKQNTSTSTVTSRPLQTKSNFGIQQLQINKTRAKERDERDFLQQVVNTVQDSSKEVRLTLCAVREKLEHTADQSEQNLQQIITSFLDDLCKHQDKILNAIQEKDSNSCRMHDLERDLAMRDAKIQSLEKIIDDQEKDKPNKIVCALQKELLPPHQKVDEKLSELLETTRDNHEQYTQQIHEQKQQLEQQQKLYSDLKKAHQTQVKDTEKRLMTEVSNLRKDIRKKESSCLQDILEQLKMAQEQQNEELESHISRLIDRPTEVSYHSRDQGLQRKEIQALFKKHWESVERFVETQFNKQLKVQEQQLESAVQDIKDAECKHDQFSSFLSLPQFEDKMGQYHEDFKKQVECLHENHVKELQQLRTAEQVKQREQKNKELNVQTDVGRRFRWDKGPNTNKYDGLDRKSTNEACRFPKSTVVFGRCEANGSLPVRESAIVSPLTANYKKLNSRSFFSKSTFSPVATVQPLRNETQLISNLLHAENQQTEAIVTETVTHIEKKKTNKRKKKRSKFAKAEKSKPLTSELAPSSEPVQGRVLRQRNLVINQQANKSMPKTLACRGKVSETTPGLTSTSKAISLNDTTLTSNRPTAPSVNSPNKNVSVYEFRDEDIGDRTRATKKPFVGSRTQSYRFTSHKNELMTMDTSQTVTFPRPLTSPCIDSNESRDSSPSLSITEVVVRRRIKCDKQTPDMNLHFNTGGLETFARNQQLPIYDILSTPTINADSKHNNPTFWTYQHSLRTAPPMRRAGKRRLCDTQMDDNVIQCLRNQTKQLC